MRYTVVSCMDNKKYIYDTNILERTYLQEEQLSDLSIRLDELELEYIQDDIIVLSTGQNTIHILVGNSKYVLEYTDILKINSIPIIGKTYCIFLHCCHRDDDFIIFEFKYGFSCEQGRLLILDIRCNKFFITSDMKVYSELKNVSPIHCDIEEYRKTYRRVKLLGK